MQLFFTEYLVSLTGHWDGFVFRLFLLFCSVFCCVFFAYLQLTLACTEAALYVY